jgi:hypothetical protein
MEKEDDIVTFETYYDPMLAHIVRTKLESNNIPCFLADEGMIGVIPIYNQALGGIKIKVFARDIEKCKALIAEDSALPHDFEAVPGTDNVVYCPYCGSANVRHEPTEKSNTGWLEDVISVIQAINPLHSDKNWHCNNCQQNFE